jgi:hypothetical protein
MKQHFFRKNLKPQNRILHHRLLDKELRLGMKIDRVQTRNKITQWRNHRDIVTGNLYPDLVVGCPVIAVSDTYTGSIANLDGNLASFNREVANCLHAGDNSRVRLADSASTGAQAGRVVHLDLLVQNPSEIEHPHEQDDYDRSYKRKFDKALPLSISDSVFETC